MSIANTFTALISKSWAPVAQAVEFALAKIIPLALGLFVSLLGLGGISKRISKVMEKLRTPVDKGLSKVFEKMGYLLDPVGAVVDGVSGLKDKATGKKKGKDKDDDDQTSDKKKDDDDASTTSPSTSDKSTSDPSSSKVTGKTTSTKESSTPAEGNNAKQTTKDQADKAKSSDTPNKAGSTERQDQKSVKDKNKDDDKLEKSKKDKNDDEDDSVKRLRSAMNAVDNAAEQKRDPSSVDKELAGIKKKYDLDTLTLKKKGTEKYIVKGKANASTSKSKSKSKRIQRKSSKSKNGDWTDKDNSVRIKTKLKAKKNKGGQFTVDAKLIEGKQILEEVERKLKFRLRINGRMTSIQAYAAKLKAQYRLKKLEVKGNRKTYAIRGELSKGSAQRQATTGASGSFSVSPTVETAIQRSEGRGEAIAPHIRTPMEDAFGMDFSPVRIHADSEGDRLSRSLDANAFTTGQDIFFRQGAYAPDSPQGKHLLAHELTHVVQQSGERPTIIPHQVQRQAADPPTIQRLSQSNPSSGFWVQRESEDDAAVSTPDATDDTTTANASDAMAGMGGAGMDAMGGAGMGGMGGVGMAGAIAGGVAREAGTYAVRKGLRLLFPQARCYFLR